MRHDELPDPHATWTAELPGIRDAVYRALAPDEGPCDPAGVTRHSWRGRLVRMTPAWSAEMPSLAGRPCLVLTAHAYSQRRFHQIVVPVVGGSGRGAGKGVLEIQDRPWLAALGPDATTALISPRFAHSVWQKAHIDSCQQSRDLPYLVIA